MKFKTFLDNLNKMLNKNPEIGDYDVITSIDDEGNGFELVSLYPTLGKYNKVDKEFIDYNQLEELGLDEDDINSICVN